MYDRACSGVSRQESDRRAASGDPFTVRLRVPVAVSHMEAQEERWEVARALSGAAYHEHEAEAVAAAARLLASGGSDSRGVLGGSPLAHELLRGPAEPSSRGALSGASGHGVASTVVRDVVLGSVPFSHSAVDDCVLLKSDGWPTYHLASVVDDITMRITDVVRGQEWLTSAPRHVLIYRGLGVSDAAIPRFTHLPLLLGPDRKKLSKRAGDASVGDFRERYGVLPGALLNFVAFLGWTPATSSARSDSAVRGAAERSEADVMSVAELAEQFTLSDVHRSNAVVDRKRLEWLQGRHAHGAIHAVSAARATAVAAAAVAPGGAETLSDGSEASTAVGGMSGLSETVAVMEAVVSELDWLLGLGPAHSDRDHDHAADYAADYAADDAADDAAEAANAGRGGMRPGWIERSASLRLSERLSAGLTGRALPVGVESGTSLLMTPMDGSSHLRCIETPSSASFRRLQTAPEAASSADHLAVRTVAEAFHPRYLLLCVLLQHERANLPAELAPLLLPLLVPPLPSDPASLTAEQSAAFDKAWHPEARGLLQRLHSAWAELSRNAGHADRDDHEASDDEAFRLADSLGCLLRPEAAHTDAAQSAEGAMAEVKAVMKAYAKAQTELGAQDDAVAEPDAAKAAAGGAAAARKKRRKKMPASRLMLPLRWALTGQAVGPPLGDLIAVLGRDVCMARLETAISLSGRIGEA
jgi:glutamyl/glutaminyl-tRNA synthetase